LEAVSLVSVTIPVVVRRCTVEGLQLRESSGVRGAGVSGTTPEEQDEADEGHDESESQELLEESLLLFNVRIKSDHSRGCYVGYDDRASKSGCVV